MLDNFHMILDTGIKTQVKIFSMSLTSNIKDKNGKLIFSYGNYFQAVGTKDDPEYLNNTVEYDSMSVGMGGKSYQGLAVQIYEDIMKKASQMNGGSK